MERLVRAVVCFRPNWSVGFGTLARAVAHLRMKGSKKISPRETNRKLSKEDSDSMDVLKMLHSLFQRTSILPPGVNRKLGIANRTLYGLRSQIRAEAIFN